jgi:DNA repair protein RecN (Recombination protein N)
MLRFLRIRNLAVIESAEVEFQPGFNVLTGETGAGKSILVEAVGLLVGGRASADLVRTGEAQATIEALFDGHAPAEGESGAGELVVRREVTQQGRSRSFVNGELATAGALRDLSQRLVELHGQHEHQALLDPLTHLPLLDAFAGLDALAARVASAWSSVRALREQLDRSRMDAGEKAARLDLITFQLGEIEKAAPKRGEDDELTALRNVLASAERIHRLCEESYSALYDDDNAVLGRLGGVWKRVGELATIDPKFAPYAEARDGLKSQLEDLALFLRSYADGVDASPGRLQQVEDRLALLERLKRRYGPTLQEVVETHERLAQERNLLSGAGERTEDLERALAGATERFLADARELSRRRRTASGVFARQMMELLAELAMEGSRFEVRFEDVASVSAWSEHGIDRAEFFLSPNVGEDLRPLTRIVSGGELSRVMLALKTLGTTQGLREPSATTPGVRDAQGHPVSLQPKTLIFDEVDAGIGGRVADVVGAKLLDLGRRSQVLCITHLPQIAARASAHFRIEKTVRGSRTVTQVQYLDEAERVQEIARMIGGSAVTDAVLASARQMLSGGVPARQAGAAKVKTKAKGESESRPRPAGR